MCEFGYWVRVSRSRYLLGEGKELGEVWFEELESSILPPERRQAEGVLLRHWWMGGGRDGTYSSQNAILCARMLAKYQYAPAGVDGHPSIHCPSTNHSSTCPHPLSSLPPTQQQLPNPKSRSQGHYPHRTSKSTLSLPSATLPQSHATERRRPDLQLKYASSGLSFIGAKHQPDRPRHNHRAKPTQ